MDGRTDEIVCSSSQYKRWSIKLWLHVFWPVRQYAHSAIDHGIEEPRERQARGKAPEGRIEIHARDENGVLHLEIWDDGRGLNMRRVRQLSEAHPIHEATAELRDEAAAELIFMPGFTTKSEVSTVSGRGVGMDAVRQFLERAGGSIAIEFTDKKVGEDYRSFRFVVCIPQNLYGNIPSEGPLAS